MSKTCLSVFCGFPGLPGTGAWGLSDVMERTEAAEGRGAALAAGQHSHSTVLCMSHPGLYAWWSFPLVLGAGPQSPVGFTRIYKAAGGSSQL